MQKKARSRQKRRPDLKSIAKAAGVAPMTVSRALRDPSVVASATLARIMAVVEKEGFILDQVASSMRSERLLIGTVVPPLINSGIAEQVQGMSDACQERGVQLLLVQGDLSPEAEYSAIRMLLGWRPAGLILQAFVQSPAARKLLRTQKLPVVEISEIRGREPIDMTVGVSNFDTAFALTTRLANIGYERIAFVSTPIHANDRLQQRRIGYRAALEAKGLPTSERLEVEMPITSAGGSEAVSVLKSRDPDIDAIFFSSDTLAIGAVQECHRRGWKIPQDLAIAGYGDIDLAGQLCPRLTTVRVPRYQMGRRAIEHLARRIAGESGLPKSVAIPFDIVERETT
jgi:LacI family transcriptional regulator, gluconate utilization system Gnt-I transcriptional repressor